MKGHVNKPLKRRVTEEELGFGHSYWNPFIAGLGLSMVF